MRFEAELDLAAGSVRCNCSLCFKARAWFTPANPTEFSQGVAVPIASIMEPGSDGIATVMEPPDRQGHGATPRVGVRRIASLMEPPDRQGHGATS